MACSRDDIPSLYPEGFVRARVDCLPDTSAFEKVKVAKWSDALRDLGGNTTINGKDMEGRTKDVTQQKAKGIFPITVGNHGEDEEDEAQFTLVV